MKINSTIIGLGIAGASVIVSAVAVIISSRANKRIKNTCETLDASIDAISEDVELDVSEEIVTAAIERAASIFAREEVRKLGKDALDSAKKEIRTEVKKSVNMAYANLKSGVKEELDRQIRDIDISGIKKQVIEEASEKAKDKFSNELDAIAVRFSNDLESSSKIYKTIADKLGG